VQKKHVSQMRLELPCRCQVASDTAFLPCTRHSYTVWDEFERRHAGSQTVHRVHGWSSWNLVGGSLHCCISTSQTPASTLSMSKSSTSTKLSRVASGFSITLVFLMAVVLVADNLHALTCSARGRLTSSPPACFSSGTGCAEV